MAFKRLKFQADRRLADAHRAAGMHVCEVHRAEFLLPASGYGCELDILALVRSTPRGAFSQLSGKLNQTRHDAARSESVRHGASRVQVRPTRLCLLVAHLRHSQTRGSRNNAVSLKHNTRYTRVKSVCEDYPVLTVVFYVYFGFFIDLKGLL